MTPSITIDDETFKRTMLKGLVAFYLVIGGLLLAQELSYALKWHDWSFLWSGAIIWFLLLQQVSNLYFNRDQKRDQAMTKPAATLVLARSRLETIIEIGWICGFIAYIVFQGARFPKLDGEPLFASLFMPLLAIAFAIYTAPMLFRDLRHLITGERVMRLTAEGLELPEFHDGLIAWNDIQAMHLGQRILITLQQPAAAARARRWWQCWPNFGSWSDDKKVLRFFAIQFNAGAREIAVALAARLQASSGTAQMAG